MISKLSKTIMLALAIVLVAAPLVLAQQSDRPGSSSCLLYTSDAADE